MALLFPVLFLTVSFRCALKPVRNQYRILRLRQHGKDLLFPCQCLIHELTYGRNNHNVSVHGYQEEGTITTPFDMRVQNQLDRFDLVKDAIMHLPQLGNRGSFLIQKMNDKLVEHKQYIAEYGQDLEEIRNWQWHTPEDK